MMAMPEIAYTKLQSSLTINVQSLIVSVQLLSVDLVCSQQIVNIVGM